MKPLRRLLLIGIETFYGREVFQGIHAYCRQHGEWQYQMCMDNSPETVKKAAATLVQWKPQGIIAHIRSERVERLVKGSGLPVVNFSGGREFDLPTVTSDNQAVGAMAARHFLERGLRNFAFAAWTPELYGQRRCQGFMAELKKAGFGCEVFTDVFTPNRLEFDWAKNRQRMNRWLMSMNKPVGVLCIHDLRAHEVAMSCHHMGLRVPDDVAILGAGNEDLCVACSPPLSSIDFDTQRIGYETARMLDQLLRGKAARDLVVPPRRVVTRQSTDIVAIDDPDIAAAVRFVREHACKSICVKDLLREVPISRRTLELRFARIVGRTPKQEIMRLQIEKAKTLLAETTMAMPEVAAGSGFASQKMFSTAFRREAGITPTVFRRRRLTVLGR